MTKIINAIEQKLIDDILNFWFGKPEDGWPTKSITQRWFLGGEIFDRQIQAQFENYVNNALNGAYEHWKQTPESCLALILLSDQFTRNIFRGTEKAFAGDAVALDAAQYAIVNGLHLQLENYQRIFMYMPYEHSEFMEQQDHAVALFEELAQDDSTSQTKINSFVEHARLHRGIIHRFNRFPHRNQVLNRSSSMEELAYLMEGVRFGQ